MTATVRQVTCESERRALVRLVRAGLAWSALCLDCHRLVVEQVGVTVCPVCGGPIREWEEKCR